MSSLPIIFLPLSKPSFYQDEESLAIGTHVPVCNGVANAEQVFKKYDERKLSFNLLEYTIHIMNYNSKTENRLSLILPRTVTIARLYLNTRVG